jgi:hypothetical protein
MFFYKNGFGYTLGDIFANSSGHPGDDLLFRDIGMDFLPTQHRPKQLQK